MRAVDDRARRATWHLLLLLWCVAVTALVAMLSFSHWWALPPPDTRDARLVVGVRELSRDAPGWSAIHVLYTECRCSRRILDHLRASERPHDVRETVVLVGEERIVAAALAARDYYVVSVSPAELTARYGIEGAPLLIVVDPGRAIRYVGGYTRRQQGADISDLAILRDLRTGTGADDLPVFGCAVSRRLKSLADPFTIGR